MGEALRRRDEEAAEAARWAELSEKFEGDNPAITDEEIASEGRTEVHAGVDTGEIRTSGRGKSYDNTEGLVEVIDTLHFGGGNQLLADQVVADYVRRQADRAV